MDKRLLTIVLGVALIFSFALNIWQNSRLLQYSKEYLNGKNIVGTYVKDGSFPTDRKYFVFTSENEYMYYRESEILEKGTYKIDESQNGSRVISLFREEDGDETQLIRIGDSIFYPKDSQSIVVFDRIGDIPAYIGVDS